MILIAKVIQFELESINDINWFDFICWYYLGVYHILFASVNTGIIRILKGPSRTGCGCDTPGCWEVGDVLLFSMWRGYGGSLSSLSLAVPQTRKSSRCDGLSN